MTPLDEGRDFYLTKYNTLKDSHPYDSSGRGKRSLPDKIQHSQGQSSWTRDQPFAETST